MNALHIESINIGLCTTNIKDRKKNRSISLFRHAFILQLRNSGFQKLRSVHEVDNLLTHYVRSLQG